MANCKYCGKRIVFVRSRKDKKTGVIYYAQKYGKRAFPIHIEGSCSRPIK